MKLLMVIALLIFGTVSVYGDDFFEPSTTIGAYGELHINHKNPEGKAATNSADFHRFVLFFNHTWTPKFSFVSEVELEHNYVDGESGELELEQAYVSYKHSKLLELRGGVLLPDVGLINQRHEPPLFLSVERPGYHKYIIPTTWFGNGFAVAGSFKNKIEYQFTLMEGLNSEGIFSKSGLRGGRQKGYKADINTVLLNLAVHYVGTEGLFAGFSYSRNQKVGKQDETFDSIDLIEGHIQFKNRHLHLTGEVAFINYTKGEDALYEEHGDGLEQSFGYYVEAGYNVGAHLFKEAKLIPWVRFSQYNTAFSIDSESEDDETHKRQIIGGGITFLPIPSVSLKLDFLLETAGKDDVETKMINAGVGFNF